MGVLFIGKEGMLRADYDTRTLYPIEKFKDFQAPPPTIPKSIGHHKEFFEACKTRRPDDLQLRLLRGADRSGVARHGGVSGGQEAGVGRREPEGHQLPRGRSVYPPSLPRRMDAVETGGGETFLSPLES